MGTDKQAADPSNRLSEEASHKGRIERVQGIEAIFLGRPQAQQDRSEESTVHD
jgi:hypothetical protein